MINLGLKIKGMSCASCAASIEKEVRHVEGVISSSVNYALEKGFFEISESEVEPLVRTKSESLGYQIIS